jgi:hypothetical protein
MASAQTAPIFPATKQTVAKWSKQLQLILTMAVFSLAMWLGFYSSHPQRAWLFNAALIGVFCALLGKWIMNDAAGIFISNRNLVSLSRFQTVMWTVIIFSSYGVILLQRVLHGIADPLNITVDSNLWALLGISFASLIGTPFIQSFKTDGAPNAEAVRAASLALKEPAADIQKNAQGMLYANTSPADARISDMFQGDEVGNTAYVDVSKLQMFLLTLILGVYYCAQLWHMFVKFDSSVAGANFANLNALPSLSDRAVQLLAISHAGYLSFKAVGHTNTQTS